MENLSTVERSSTPQPARFFSPKVREPDDETRERSELLRRTMEGRQVLFEKDELVGFEEFASDDDWVTLQNFFQVAEEAARKMDRATLVALKRLGQSLLHSTYLVGDEREEQARVWAEQMPADSKSRLLVRVAEMIVLKAEIEYLKLREQEGTFDDISVDRKEALAKQFRGYARNVDIPEEFTEQLQAAVMALKPGPKAEASVLEEEPATQAETPTIKGSDALAETAKAGVPEVSESLAAQQRAETVVQMVREGQRLRPEVAGRVIEQITEQLPGRENEPARKLVQLFQDEIAEDARQRGDVSFSQFVGSVFSNLPKWGKSLLYIPAVVTNLTAEVLDRTRLTKIIMYVVDKAERGGDKAATIDHVFGMYRAIGKWLLGLAPGVKRTTLADVRRRVAKAARKAAEVATRAEDEALLTEIANELEKVAKRA